MQSPVKMLTILELEDFTTTDFSDYNSEGVDIQLKIGANEDAPLAIKYSQKSDKIKHASLAPCLNG